jgi:hypothetical protein
MASCSIPNSTPAIGRSSTPLSRRSRKQNSASACFFAALCPRSVFGAWTVGIFNAQRSRSTAPGSIQAVGRWTLSVERWAFSFGRVKGAWWSSRSSKPLSVPHTRDRGRFDSYPLRQFFSRHPERSEAESKGSVELPMGSATGLLDFARNGRDPKEVKIDVA